MNLERLIDTWRSPLTGLLAARGASWAEATELAQDVFAEAWLSRATLTADEEDERAVGAWLAGIARNLHRVAARRRLRAMQQLPDEVGVEGEEPGLDDDETLRVRAAITRLPDREREVVQAFYLDETSAARVAALLETSERAVEGLLRRARARLKAALAEAVGKSS
ncbi:MAG: sigma-70 family RNA polymerase sigma factor [bacterium]|nr:sigma-70 family RNA polymerase sigma factor [bacterium]